jgi:hypothetical protein
VRWPAKLIGVCVLVAACFSPRYPEGSACIDECPGDLSCVDGRCVRGGATNDASTDASPDANTACPPGYVRNAGTGSSYRVVGTPANLGVAVNDCEDDGADARTYLAIPDNLAESNAIDSLATNDTWLGITDFPMEGTWVTVLGTVQTFFRWAQGQPNGGTAENCAFMSDATWQDADCALAKPYVCECR